MRDPLDDVLLQQSVYQCRAGRARAAILFETLLHLCKRDRLAGGEHTQQDA